MVNSTFTVWSALKALGSAIADWKLSTEAGFSRSSLARGREMDVANRCQTILNLGTENAEVLAANDLKTAKAASRRFPSCVRSGAKQSHLRAAKLCSPPWMKS